jgi:Cys-rich protein (TIGR01571 family)
MAGQGNYPPPAYPQMDRGGHPNMGYVPPQQHHHHHSSNTTLNTTMVVINQPSESTDWESSPRQNTRDWSTGLCGCCEDCGVCCCALFCTWCLLCQITKQTGQGCCVACCFPEFALAGSRLRLRTMFGIKGDMCNDACCTIWCTLCVLCQLKRQMNIIKADGGKLK